MTPDKPLTRYERERAMQESPKQYPQNMPCAVCGNRWMQHKGTLCPSRVGDAMRVGTEIIPILPSFEGSNTTFIPDVAWENPNPDFDVV